MLSEAELMAGKHYTFHLGHMEAYLFWNVFPVGADSWRPTMVKMFCIEIDGQGHREMFPTYSEACKGVEALQIKYARETAIIALGLNKKRKVVR